MRDWVRTNRRVGRVPPERAEPSGVEPSRDDTEVRLEPDGAAACTPADGDGDDADTGAGAGAFWCIPQTLQ